jgi:hypothetical protein
MAIFILIVGLVSAIAGLMLARRVLTIRRWPTAEATVLERGVGAPEGPTGGSRNARFVPKLTLAIEVDGKRYESTGRSPMQETMTEADAKACIDKVPNRTRVQYNPEDPSEAYLESGSLVVAGIAASAGLMLSVWALALLRSGR